MQLEMQKHYYIYIIKDLIFFKTYMSKKQEIFITIWFLLSAIFLGTMWGIEMWNIKQKIATTRYVTLLGYISIINFFISISYLLKIKE